MKPSEILEKAAAHMERVGLFKGNYFKSGAILDMTAPCCSIGALRAASYSLCAGTPTRQERDALTDADIRVCMLVPNGMLADWNDAPERTQTEVVAKLREAAALAISEGK